MPQRFFIGIGLAFFAVLALGAAAVVGVTAVNDPANIPSKVASTTPVAGAPAAAADDSVPEFHLAATPTAPSVNYSPQGSGPASGYTVQDSDIAQLAAAVKLGGSTTGDVGKEVWARETPIAQKLLNGLCDCDQRNWLKHFVETGNEAINGSANYYQSVQLLATLRRSDADLAKNANLH